MDLDGKSLITILGLMATAAGGVWALIQFYFKQQEKIEALKDENTGSAIDRIEGSVKELSSLISIHRADLGAEMSEVKKDIEALKIVQASHIAEIKAFGEIMAKIYRHFAGEKHKHPESEKLQIGKEAWIIKEKKGGGKTGE